MDEFLYGIQGQYTEIDVHIYDDWFHPCGVIALTIISQIKWSDMILVLCGINSSIVKPTEVHGVYPCKGFAVMLK